jgi:chromatin segregation and condensation protein Rec8/ScpA/Scc1 (kleisin family)
LTWDELIEATRRWASVLAAPGAPGHGASGSVEDKIGLIVQVLKRFGRVEFSRLVQPFGDRLHGVVTLLAGLELSKRREVSLRQSRPFAPLWLYRTKEPTADATDANG